MENFAPDTEAFKREEAEMLGQLREYTRSHGLDFDENGIIVLDSVPVSPKAKKKSLWKRFTEFFNL